MLLYQNILLNRGQKYEVGDPSNSNIYTHEIMDDIAQKKRGGIENQKSPEKLEQEIEVILTKLGSVQREISRIIKGNSMNQCILTGLNLEQFEDILSIKNSIPHIWNYCNTSKDTMTNEEKTIILELLKQIETKADTQIRSVVLPQLQEQLQNARQILSNNPNSIFICHPDKMQEIYDRLQKIYSE